MRACPFVLCALLGACGDTASRSDGDVLDATDTADIAPDDGASTVASDPPPRYVDPAWVEPAAPTPAAVEAALDEIVADVEDRLSPSELATLDAEAGRFGPRAAAHGRVATLELDAARRHLVAAADVHGSLGSLAALELLVEAPDRARAALLARAELTRLGDPAGAPVTRRRLVASAWNNLGRALDGTEAAGAVHAYRQATTLFPHDPAYATGLAAALAAAELPVPAYQEARRALALERLAGLDGTSSTPARAWEAHLRAALGMSITPPSALVPRGAGGSTPVWPEVGSSLAGIRVTAVAADGTLTMSAAPFETHGDVHVGARPACEITASGASARLTCEPHPGAVEFEPWLPLPERAAVASPRMADPGLTCDNLYERLLAPEPRPLTVTPFGIHGAAEKAATGLGLALQTELGAIEGSLGVPGGGDTAYPEMCSDFIGHAGGWQGPAERVRNRCDACLCSVSAECPPCWLDYGAACDELFAIASRVAAAEEARARVDDAIHQDNLARYFAIMPILGAVANATETCEGLCAEALADDFHWAWAELVGGRTTGWLAEVRREPVIAWLQCRALMEQCPESGPGHGTPDDDPAKVPCVCLGAGPIGYCLQADGGVSLTIDAGVSVGLKGSFREGASSIRLGVGAGVSANLGPLGGSVSYMAWFDPTRGAFVGHDVSADLSIAVPGGGSVGTTFLCDAWQSDAPARASDDTELTLEATVPDPE